MTQRRIHVPLFFLFAIAAALIYKKEKGESKADLKAGDVGEPKAEWFYVSGLGSNDPFNSLSGRPGHLKHEDSKYTISYRLYSSRNNDVVKTAGVKLLNGGDSQRGPQYALDDGSEAPKDKTMVEGAGIHGGSAEPLKYLLKPCPAQGGYGAFMGVTRIWRGDSTSALDEQVIHQAQIGDTVTVEIKNLDGWLFQQFDFGRLREDLEPPPPSLKDVLSKITLSRRCLELLTSIYRVNTMLQEIDTREDWKQVLSNIEDNDILEEIKNADPKTALITSQTELADERKWDLQRVFLPLKVWEEHLTSKRFRQLTLTLNDIVLTGITPSNADDMVEAVHGKRPSEWDDLYQWATFKLARKDVSAAVSDDEKTEALKNDAAWLELVGKPRLHMPCKVSLKLPDQNLELPTKIVIGAKASDAKFDLIGITMERLSWAILAFVAVVGFLGWLALTTNILRDTSGRLRPDGIEPVSLGKTQMAFWFILTATAFVFLWITKNEIDTINVTCLILMGIGAGTALGAAFIEDATSNSRFLVTCSLARSRDEIGGKIGGAILVCMEKLSDLITDADLRMEFIAALRKLSREGAAERTDAGSGSAVIQGFDGLLKRLEEKWGVPKDLGEPKTSEDAGDAIIALGKKLTRRAAEAAQADKDGELGILASELELLSAQRAGFKKMKNSAWERLFVDWLCEGSSEKYNLHRFQILAWTLLLGFVFVAKVLSERAMPEFSTTTLALLGISAGTYLGFKIPSGGGGTEEKPQS